LFGFGGLWLLIVAIAAAAQFALRAGFADLSVLAIEFVFPAHDLTFLLEQAL